MKKILVTGATGFIGQPLCESLASSDKFVLGAVRSKKNLSQFENLDYVSIGDIDYSTNWKRILTNFDCVIHCAGRAHVTKEIGNNLLDKYRLLNVDGTKRLAEQAAESGVKRFIYMSSIKVNGENTNRSIHASNNIDKRIFMHDDIPSPEDPYGISKWEAEKVLWDISAKTDLDVIIIRSPLVYGKGVKGNLARLLKLMRSGVPLPFSLINNHRSLIGLENLIDIIKRCVDHPSAAGKTFLVSDGKDLSTPDLLKHIAFEMGRPVRLFPFPIFLLKIIAKILRKENDLNRLIGSLRIDSSYAQKILDWKPPTSITDGIKKMVKDL